MGKYALAGHYRLHFFVEIFDVFGNFIQSGFAISVVGSFTIGKTMTDL